MRRTLKRMRCTNSSRRKIMKLWHKTKVRMYEEEEKKQHEKNPNEVILTKVSEMYIVLKT